MVDPKNNLNCYQKFTYGVVSTTESFFYGLGYKVGSKPIQTIVICWVVVILSSLGGLRFYQEKNPLKLWVPPESAFAKDSEWLMTNLQTGYRQESIILTAPNVLVPDVIQKLFDIHIAVQEARSPNNISWNDVCFKLPKVDSKLARMLAKETSRGEDITENMDIAFLCSFLESIPMACFHQSILELWNYNRKEIRNLTTENIIHRINHHDEMMFMGHLKNYVGLLSDIQRNESGHIIGAKAVQNIWMTKVNFSAVDMSKAGNLAGTADWASEEALEWELEFEAVIRRMKKILPSMIELYYASARTYGDVTNKSMFQDMDKLILGIFIMAIYVQFVISKMNMLEARIVLGSIGLLSVGMSFVVGCGICFIIGIPYGPVHTSLPFLLMGLGVDDMFVIMACYDDLSKEQKKLPIPEMVGLMLKHAGVSITITSVTDILAFIIGSSTILPCLQSYCFYAAISVLMTFVFAITFFCACFAIDQKRIEKKRNGIIPCITYDKDYQPNSCSQKQISNEVFKFVFDKIILTRPAKILIVILTVTLAVISINNCLKLEQRFDPHWFVPDSEDLHKFFEKRKEFYPTYGYEGGIYMGDLNYTQEIPKIRHLVQEFKSNPDIVIAVLDWLDPFRDYVLQTFKTDVYNETLDDTRFNLFLSKFLVNPKYSKYQSSFQFAGPLECGALAPEIKISIIPFNFPVFKGPEEYLPAMHKVLEFSEKANFTTGNRFCTTWSYTFGTWITDEIIDIEVLRNLQLALLAVMVCTILLVADIQTCFWIFICVLLSMLNVCGFMQMWGLTIDLVSCIGLELAIGLCVDYATHIGHTFLTQEGSRRDRALKTVTTIGSAVLYGGLSTLIGVFMLKFSEAYTFKAFFKIFFLVILFGLYHGVVVMPVILSMIGPEPYVTFKKKKYQIEMEERNLKEELKASIDN